MSDTAKTRKTQAQRRAESRQAVLDSALRLFGERGYADTSLDEIAADCGLTIRPIYHYFGNKKALFAAVNEVMEQRILDSIRTDSARQAGTLENWRAYLALCDDPAFRRIVLVDSPNILGRERWASGPVMEKARTALEGEQPVEPQDADQYRTALVNRVVMAAFTEAALMVAEAEDIEMAKQEAEELMVTLFSRLRRRASR